MNSIFKMTGPFVEVNWVKISVHMKSIFPIFATQMRAITAGLAYVSIRRVYAWPGYSWDPNSACPDPRGYLQIECYDKDHCIWHLIQGWRNSRVTCCEYGPHPACQQCPFYPRPVLAFGFRRCLCLSVCPCVCVCINHLLDRAITRDQFKVGSRNLDQRCKRTWLRSLWFCGAIDLDLQGQT